MSAKILIIEDEIIVQQHLRRLLERFGYQVSGTAASGSEAISLAMREPPDLALLDIHLQGPMDGIEVARVLRQRSEAAVVFLTAYADKATLERTREVEAAGYLVKPFEESEVQAAITTALTKERAVRRVEEHGKDLRSILDQLEVGTAMVDEAGRLSFVSRPAAELLGLGDLGQKVGQPWRERLPFSGSVLKHLGRLIETEPQARSRLPVEVSSQEGREPRRLEIDVRDDPRDVAKRIFFFYDVTDRHDLRRLLEDEVRRHGMVGRSPSMQRVFDQIDRVAASSASVLIEGETGTGKELVARAVHQASPRAAGSFVAVNCAGLTESLLSSQLFGHRRGAFTGAVSDHRGLFETADGGTLFLDEIGDISTSVQTSLLRVLEDGRITPLGSTVSKRVDVRIVTATHRDLNEEIEAGRFRADLVYRIRVGRVRLPALRERGEDLELLAHFFLDRSRAAAGRSPMRFSSEALDLLASHRWPGNVRELKSTVEHAVICARTEVVEAEDLPPEVVPAPSPERLSIPAGGDERSRILAALEQTSGNRSKAAKLLGISRATFYRRLEQLSID